MKVDLLLETLCHHSSLSGTDTRALEAKWRNIQSIFRSLKCNLAAANTSRHSITTPKSLPRKNG